MLVHGTPPPSQKILRRLSLQSATSRRPRAMTSTHLDLAQNVLDHGIRRHLRNRQFCQQNFLLLSRADPLVQNVVSFSISMRWWWVLEQSLCEPLQ